jgi:hypothetical protein
VGEERKHHMILELVELQFKHCFSTRLIPGATALKYVTNAILPGKARTALNKRLHPETGTGG